MSESADTGQPPALLNSEEFREFVRSVQINSIEWIRLVAERYRPGASPKTRYELSSTYGRADDGRDLVGFRFDIVARIVADDESVELAKVEASAVFYYDVPGAAGVSDEFLEFFGGTSVPLMAIPFLREGINSMATRVGQPGVLLPLFTRSTDGSAVQASVAAEVDD